jgi:hypothetical protein
MEEDAILLFRNRVYVPNSQELRNLVLQEMYNVPYARHPRYQKTITVVRGQYFWSGMKKDFTDYLAKCMECRKVKVEHMHPTELLQPLPIPEWKWEIVTIDFITKLPRTARQHDSIMVVVDKLTKAAHYIMIKVTHKAANVAEIYMRDIARMHGAPKAIVLDRDLKFPSNFCKGLFKGFGTNLNFSTAYHPKSDGQTERINWIIEDMLRMYVMDKPFRWEDYIHLIEFAYNNEYQEFVLTLKHCMAKNATG